MRLETKDNVIYEGTLFHIDQDRATVALANGTPGCRAVIGRAFAACSLVSGYRGALWQCICRRN
jgi:hypothetical protein